MSLKVVVHSASNLPDVDFSGHSDPFVVLSFQGEEHKTPYQKNTLNPTWPPKEATFNWPLGNTRLLPNDKLSIKVKDYERAWFKRLLGQVEIPLGEVREKKKVEKRAYDLEDGKHNAIMDATITLDIAYIPSGAASDEMGKEREEGKESPDDDELDDHDEEGDDRTGKVNRKRIEEKKRTRRRLTRKWSDKTKDFQIGVHIIEGRYLPGSDIYPLVRVTVAGQRQQTNVAQSTNKPIYNKMLSFNFRGTSEAELFDEPILLEVFNSRGAFRPTTRLGFFKFDIGYVYERKGHGFICKWIMLCKPDGKKDENNGISPLNKPKMSAARSPAGYLKVTAVVQGPGDKLPVGIDVVSTDDKDEDIDKNCLIPVGVHRRSASFNLKVYQANDLPQMDTGVMMKFKSFFAKWSRATEEEDERTATEEHNLVDPYLTFSFSGKEVWVKEQVSTEIKHNNSNPEFSQVLKIPFMYPSMCERLKLQLMDWDQGTKHDFISTAFLSLSSISGPGGVDEGFLPQFGPCFVNFYGSPREYHQMPDKYEYLNKGIPFKNLSSFTLYACFHEATMVAVRDRPVEFELSIGNKGTKFDESVAHSNTTPCKPVYDGSHYHYLPWGREKPCVWIECKWEDIAFRIEPLNILNTMKEKLEKDLEDLRGLKDDSDGFTQTQSMLEDFCQTCGKNLTRFKDDIPKLSGQRNSLDTEIRKLRLAELENLMNDAKALSKKPESERRKEKVTVEIKKYIRRIRSMAMEPQLSIPDVILWMISGNKRIAYYRIPAHDLLYSVDKDACGKFCGKIIELSLKYPGREGSDAHLELPALVRLELWLGLATHQQQWIKRENGEFNVYAETYQNEMRKSKNEWEPSKSRNWPDFSDVAGNLNLPKKSFVKPAGWEFTGDWMEHAGELSTIRHPDENLTEFMDEVYEHEARKFPGGDWEPGTPRYVDSYGDETALPTDPPMGWSLVLTQADEGKKTPRGWSVDLSQGVDDKGWEYSPHRSYWDYGPEEKYFHLSRRRRLTRLRRRDPGKQIHKDRTPTDGWEYARTLHESFHPEEKSTDCLRRKRWLHKVVSLESKGGNIKFPIFKVSVQGKKGKQSALCVLPRMLVTYQSAMKYQLWVSIYQARGLLAQDDTGMNDPYVRVTFSNKSQKSKTLPQTLCPTWNQTLIFEEVDIFGNPRDLVTNPPSVVIELFDFDKIKHDFLGRCMFKPKVLQLLEGYELPEPKLAWHKVYRGEQDGGQILVECELFPIDGAHLPARPKKRDDVYPVRDGLKPVTKKKAIEILSWGVRDIKGSKPLLIPKPSVEFECNQKVLKSDEIISDMEKCPNFSYPVLERRILELPENDEYAPPLNIRVFDNTMFGRSLIGLHEIQSLKRFEVRPETVNGQSQVQDTDKTQKQATPGKGKQPATSDQKTQEFKEQDVFDWWSKYYASRDEKAKKKAKDKASTTADSEDIMSHTQKYLRGGYDTLTIYPDKLENVPQFGGFNDFVTTFPLRKGKTKSTRDGDTEVGQFKGAIRIFDDPDSYDDVDSMAMMYPVPYHEPVKCIVRVYVIRATQLQPKDTDGLADPYLLVSLGETTKGQPADHIAKTLKPVFGKMFEFKAKIPLVKDLKIQVMDYDYPDPDDLIGETEIDLEQRLLSRYHATCGLPKTYFKCGPFEWRDTLTPFQLLAKHCTLTGKELVLEKEKIKIDKISHSLKDFEKEEPSNPDVGEPLQRLALHLLHKCGLVPEHVETRPLFSKVQPDIEQGKLEMWVDIFTEEDEEIAKQEPDQTDGALLPIMIVKRPSTRLKEGKLVEKSPLDELLRAPVFIDPREPIKYELRVIIWNTSDVLLDDKSLFGEKMSDIFVKASLDGNGSFNWRMVFPLEYLPIEKEIVIKEKVHHLGRDVKVETKPPLLKVQIYDKDRFSSSDFIGDLELNLSKLVRPCVHPSHCGTNKDPREHNQFIDLFAKERKTGWWACRGDKEKITGKVEMSLEILKEDDAKANPVGRGQSEPNQHPTLSKPIRPPHSFLWYLAPFKTFRYIIWRNYKGFFIKLLIFCLLVLLIAYFVYSIPSYTAKKVVGD